MMKQKTEMIKDKARQTTKLEVQAKLIEKLTETVKEQNKQINEI